MPAPFTFLAVWRYIVKPECVAEFERTYGPDGQWVHLFRRQTGYLKTELLCENAELHQYVTIDRWESVDAFDNFRAAFGAEYEALDVACAALTTKETLLGYFLSET